MLLCLLFWINSEVFSKSFRQLVVIIVMVVIYLDVIVCTMITNLHTLRNKGSVQVHFSFINVQTM